MPKFETDIDFDEKKTNGLLVYSTPFIIKL